LIWASSDALATDEVSSFELESRQSNTEKVKMSPHKEKSLEGAGRSAIYSAGSPAARLWVSLRAACSETCARRHPADPTSVISIACGQPIGTGEQTTGPSPRRQHNLSVPVGTHTPAKIHGSMLTHLPSLASKKNLSHSRAGRLCLREKFIPLEGW